MESVRATLKNDLPIKYKGDRSYLEPFGDGLYSYFDKSGHLVEIHLLSGATVTIGGLPVQTMFESVRHRMGEPDTEELGPWKGFLSDTYYLDENTAITYYRIQDPYRLISEVVIHSNDTHVVRKTWPEVDQPPAIRAQQFEPVKPTHLSLTQDYQSWRMMEKSEIQRLDDQLSYEEKYANDGAPCKYGSLAGPFTTDITKLQTIAALTDDTNHTNNSQLKTPEEIARIREGGYTLFIGAFVNSGIFTWSGLDIDRHLFVHVEGLADADTGWRKALMPKPENLTKNQFIRQVEFGGKQRTELVTLLPATVEQVRDFSCLANHLASIVEPPLPVFSRQTDTAAHETILLHDGKALSSGGGRARWRAEDKLSSFVGDVIYEERQKNVRSQNVQQPR